MKKILTILWAGLSICQAIAQTPDSTRKVVAEEKTFFALSAPKKFEAAIQASDVELVFDLTEKKGKYYAIFLAVQDYKDTRITTLTHPYFDAQNLRDVILESYNFEQADTRVLKNPTRSDIIRTLDSLTRKLTRQDNLLIFYAGHGYWDGGLETGYWLPADARKDDKANWLSNGEILTYLKNIKARHTLLISDACFSGSLFKAVARDVNMEQADVMIQKLYDSPSRRAMTSGALTTVPDQSVFIENLIKQLRKNQDFYLPTTDLFVTIKNPIIRDSEAKVLPQYGELNLPDHQGGDFIFIKKKKK
jgi:hypothetical protein